MAEKEEMVSSLVGQKISHSELGALEQALKRGRVVSRHNINCLYWVFLLRKPDFPPGLWHVC